MELLVTICSHHFRVNRISPLARPAVDAFARRFIYYGIARKNGKFFREKKCVFAAATRDRHEYRFHINSLEDFKTCLKEHRVREETVEWVKEGDYPAVAVELPIKPEWELRDYQIPPVEYINAEDNNPSKLVALQTGMGKSFISMVAMSLANAFTLLIVRPMYVEKWLIDIYKTFDIEKDEVIVVQGAPHLKAFLKLAGEGKLKCKVVIISNRTLQTYYKLYEELREGILQLGYACLPQDMFKHVGASRRIIDEVHQDFHLQFKIDMYTHVKSSVSMSATMIADDDFKNKMYELAYPSHLRYNGMAYKKYINARAVIYNVKEPVKLKTSSYGAKTYSHHVFEESIIRVKSMLSGYFLLVWRLLEDSFIKNYRPGNKVIIFCASIKMCTLMTEHFQEVYNGFKVGRYVEEDPYENLMESDIIISTIQSAGTAVDIPGLQTAIMTVALKSSQGNIQGFGRLRQMKSGQTPEFIYLVCADIPKHMEYHKKKEVLLFDRAAAFITEHAGISL